MLKPSCCVTRMKVVAIANQKGGVAKTSTAINLTAALAEKGYKCLLIDIDPQANATVGSGLDKNNVTRTSADMLLNKQAPQAIHQTSFGYDIAPSNQDVTAAELTLARMTDGAFSLRNALAHAHFNGYDYIFLDCPPSLNMLTFSALSVAHSVLIPMQCEYYAMEGIADLLQTIDKVRASTNTKLRLYGILRTMYDPRTALSKQVSDELMLHFSSTVFHTIIPRNIRIAEAPSFSQPVLQYAPKSSGALAYRALADEVQRLDSISRK